MSLEAAGSSGGSLLTAGVEPAAAAAQGGTPAGANGAAPPANGAQAAQPDGPPEWAIPKYWNPEKAKDPAYLKEYAETVSKSYRHAESLLGGERIPVPKDENDEEGWNRWYAATGRPETPDAYEIERPAQLPIEYDEEGEKAFRTWAHQNGLNKRQARNLYDSYVKTQIERHGEYQKMKEEQSKAAQDALQREWGSKYSAKLQGVKGVFGQYADADFIQYVDESGLGNDPRFIRVFDRMAQDLGGERRLQGRVAPAPNTADLDRQIAEFSQKNHKALFDKDHPDHNRAVAERRKLYEQRFSE